MDLLPPVLGPLTARVAEAALFCDFDGTLAPIVDDPAAAAPHPEVPPLLARLARRLALVAVVSGRPAAFLADVLGAPPGVHLCGLYGMEEVVGGDVVVTSEAAAWRPAVAAVARLAAATAPQGTEVEGKGLSVTLHWRRRPDAEGWARDLAAREAARTGLLAQPGRMAIELRPPVAADKGTVVRRLGAGHPVVAYVGDDVADLAAFAALDELVAAGGAALAVKVAVADPESPPALAAAADVVVPGPEAVVDLLRRLAEPRGGRAAGT